MRYFWLMLVMLLPSFSAQAATDPAYETCYQEARSAWYVGRFKRGQTYADFIAHEVCQEFTIYRSSPGAPPQRLRVRGLVTVEMVNGVMKRESDYNPKVESQLKRDPAVGLMQERAPAARAFGLRAFEARSKRAQDERVIPERNIHAGVGYLALMHRQFDGRWDRMFAGYNGGEGGILSNRYGADGHPWEYAQFVMGHIAEWRRLQKCMNRAVYPSVDRAYFKLWNVRMVANVSEAACVADTFVGVLAGLVYELRLKRPKDITRMGKALKKLVTKHGFNKLAPALTRQYGKGDPDFGNRVLHHFMVWEQGVPHQKGAGR